MWFCIAVAGLLSASGAALGYLGLNAFVAFASLQCVFISQHHSLLPRAHRGVLRCLRDGIVPTDRWQGEAD